MAHQHLPDPTYRSTKNVTRSGLCPCEDGINLYYEVRGLEGAEHKVVLVMGAFGTMRWLDNLADRLADSGHFQVLTFDNRGIGASREASPRQPRADHSYRIELLAGDVWRLIDCVWGPTQAVHLYGISMGGMIAQKATLHDLKCAQASSSSPLRVRSLFLSVTSRGIYRFEAISVVMRRVLHLGHLFGVLPRIVPLILCPSLHTLVRGQMRKDHMLKTLLHHGFSPEYLALPHPSTGRQLREEWTEALHTNYESWNCFHDPDACVQHVNLLACHHLKASEAAAIATAGVTVCVHVALRDRLVPAHRQWELAKCLNASRVIVTDGGHMGDTLDHGRRFWQEVHEHFHGLVEGGKQGEPSGAREDRR